MTDNDQDTQNILNLSADGIFTEKNFENVNRESFYFGQAGKQMLGWIHTSNTPSIKRTLVLCSPLGMNYMNTYRAQRYIADYFSLAGFTVLRFDYYATGDSSGVNSDRGRYSEWLTSIEIAVDLMCQKFPENEMNMLGIKMGATLAAVLSEKISLANLILWAPYISGKKFLREIKALQLTSPFSIDCDESLIESGGIVYWPETIAELNEVDLNKIQPHARRILLVGDSNIKVYQKFLDFWTSENQIVELLETIDTQDMFLEAHHAKVPYDSIMALVRWVLNTEISPNSNSKSLIEIPTSSSTSFIYPADGPMNSMKIDIAVDETFFHYDGDSKYFGIRSKSMDSYDPDLPKLVFLNSGTTHRVAPGRLYVHLARQACGLGYEVFRVDLPGRGDSITADRDSEHDSYASNTYQAIVEALNQIQNEDENNKFILIGLCSGAYFSFNTAVNVNEFNIIDTILMNPLTFYWDEETSELNTPVRVIEDWQITKNKIFSFEHWKKAFSLQSNYGYIFRSILVKSFNLLLGAIRKLIASIPFIGKVLGKTELDRDIDLALSKNRKLSFFFSKDDYGLELLNYSTTQFDDLINMEKVTLSTIDNADHTFSFLTARQTIIGKVVEHLAKSQ